MDELEIQGKKYISSKRASELTGYAKDYIGQLARGGKVAGMRMGRAWYVDEAAILGLAGAEKTPHAEVSALLSSRKPDNTLYSIHSLTRKSNPSIFGTWQSVNYLDDQDPLIPLLVETKEVTSVPEITRKDIVFPGIVRETPRTTIQKRIVPVTTDGIVSSSQRVQKLEVQQSKIGSFKADRSFPIVYVLGSVTVAVALIIWAGSFGASNWSFKGVQSLTASIADTPSNAAVGSYFDELFTEGIALISGFLSTIFGSFGPFFSSGFIFIAHLLHLG